jgi:hypothetical protein
VVVVVAAAVTGVAAQVDVVVEVDVGDEVDFAAATDVSSSSVLGCAAEWAMPAPIATNAAALAAAVMRRARLAG